jgi:hypothetical protein
MNIILSNGNYAIVNFKRYVCNKCTISFAIYQKDGLWFEIRNETFSTDYYSSIKNFIKANY